MSPVAALVVGLVAGAVIAAAVILRVRRSVPEVADSTAPAPSAEPVLARRLLDLMDPAVVVLGPDDSVLLTNQAARNLGVVRGTRVLVPDLLRLVRDVRDGGSRRTDVALPGDLVGSGPRLLGAHAVPLESGSEALLGPVALVLQDVTEARRVEAVRRDFVANVGHELKTPVGALGLLAEAIEDASDDPETVRRFARRMTHESERLGRLVREVIDLSRLQGADPLPEPRPVEVDRVIAEAVDRTRTVANAKGIGIAVGGQDGLVVRGDEGQLATALTNLLANAVAYSPPETRIAVAARPRGGVAELAVTDSGIGIPRNDRSRVFERFYRVDQSRASSTGGTGLGLAIVKHIASNHGGSVTVWSEEGLGSTFTLRIPLMAPETTSPDQEPVAGDGEDADRPAGRVVAPQKGRS